MPLKFYPRFPRKTGLDEEARERNRLVKLEKTLEDLASSSYTLTKAEVESVLTGEITSHTHPAGGGEVNDLTLSVTWDDIPAANVPELAVTQHEAALSITESQISDLGSYLTALTPWTSNVDAGLFDISDLVELGMAAPTADIQIVTAINDSGWIQTTGTGAAIPSTGLGWYLYPVSEMAVYDSGSGTVSSPPVSTDDYYVYFSLVTANDEYLGSFGFESSADLFMYNSVRSGHVTFGASDSTGTARYLFDLDPDALTIGLGNLTFDCNQTVGAGQDNYVLTYDNSSGKISLEAAGGGSEVNDLTASVTWANIPDANVPESAVTQHEAALTIIDGQITGANFTNWNTAFGWGDHAGLYGTAAAVALNTAKVTNATHTGDVTGDTALTIATGAVDIAMLSASGTPDSTTFLRGDNTWATPAGGSINKNIGIFTVSGSQNLTTTEATIVFDTETTDVDSNYVLSSGEITSTDAGWYHVDVNVPVNDDGTAGSTRCRVFSWLQKDATTGTWADVNNVRGQDYAREASGGEGVHYGGLVELLAGEAIRVRIDQSAGTDLSTESGQVSLNIYRIDA